MRRPPPAAMLPAMAADAPIVLRLELDGWGEAIRGRLTADSGWVMPFVGWLGLAAAIE